MSRPASSTFAPFAVVLVASVAVLVGCVQGPPTPVPTYTPTTSGSATPTADPDPTHIPGGTASENHEYFTHVVATMHGASGISDGRSNIDNLVAAGFAKADMEVTADKTAIGYDVDSMLYSVKIGDQCLIAQVFPSAYTTDLAPVLGTGRCLVGQTRPIDW